MKRASFFLYTLILFTTPFAACDSRAKDNTAMPTIPDNDGRHIGDTDNTYDIKARKVNDSLELKMLREHQHQKK